MMPMRLGRRRAFIIAMLGVAALSTGSSGQTAMKYELLAGDTVPQAGRTLLRVRRLSDGLLGGYIEHQDNLAQAGACFLYNKSRAFGNARIKDNAQVYGMVYDDAVVAGDSVVYGEVFGQAQILGHAKVHGRAYDQAIIKEAGEVYGQAFGQSVVEDNAKVYGLIYGAGRASDHDVIFGSKGD
jgi:hypothetical protein